MDHQSGAGHGVASRSDIAKAFLAEDRSQIEYYEVITRNMPGRVLASHGLVASNGREYRLADGLSELSSNERDELIALCNAKLAAYLDKRGLAPWQHRRRAAGYIAGSLRYDILKRAGGRCEACGIAAEVRALEVDHILPRNLGGSDDPSNRQALCYTCNAQKRDRDDTDFGAIRRSYNDRGTDCPFCHVPTVRIVASNELACAVRDAFPVSEHHTLVIPKRHVADWFDLHQPELNALLTFIYEVRDRIRDSDGSVNGFNIGINSGTAAGQTIFHAHVHVIPRRTGDVENPRGGVRGVIPGKAHY